MFATWMALLNEIPNAVLWLIDDNPTTTLNLKAHAAAANVDLNRIQFTPRTAHIEYKAKLKLADVFLDTFPYNCGSTTNDVVQAGIPLVTLSGITLVSRMGGSILQNTNNQHLICTNFSEYKDKVLSISQGSSNFKTTASALGIDINTLLHSIHLNTYEEI
jgi:predicted O-linked N-acetylglucosamine transferase (SPINDLY family)